MLVVKTGFQAGCIQFWWLSITFKQEQTGIWQTGIGEFILHNLELYVFVSFDKLPVENMGEIVGSEQWYTCKENTVSHKSKSWIVGTGV